MAQTIRTQTVQIPNGALQIDGYLAQPAAEGSYPGVVVIQEIFGVNEHIRDVTERLAKEGYVAIAPAIYQRQAPGFEAGYSADDVRMGRVYKEQTKADELLSDISAAIAFLHDPAGAASGGVGCIGFCFGGHVAYLAATLPNVKATASFYGAGITNWIPGGGEPTLSRTKEIQGTMYAFFGMEDASIPPEQVDQIEAELEARSVPHRVFRYDGAEHGFFCDRRASYNPTAAADAWERVKALFHTELDH